MDTPSESVELWAERLANLMDAARKDGVLLDWDFSYTDWWGEIEVSSVTLSLYRNRRGADGIMRVDERATALEVDI